MCYNIKNWRKIMRDNQFLDSLICSELGIDNFFELTEWNYQFFIGKINELVQKHKKNLKENITKQDRKIYKQVQKFYIKRLKYIRKNYTPIKMKLRLEELNNVVTFVSLRMDFLEIKNVLKDIDNHDILKECNKYIKKYHLDKNKDFIKLYDADLGTKDKKLLLNIRSWINGYIEYFYDNSLMSNGITFDENLRIFVETTYLLQKSERGENVKNNIRTKMRKTWDYILYLALLLISIVSFIAGTFIKNDIIQNLIYSIAVTFLTTFLIKILDNIKQCYYEHQIFKIKNLFADIAKCNQKIDNCLEDYKRSIDFENKIGIFLDYKSDIDYYLKCINNLLKVVSISGEPFTNNYYSLKRYYEFIMSPLYVKAKHLFEFENGKYTLVKCKEDMIENMEEGMKECIIGTHLIISDLYGSIKYNIEEKLMYYEKLKS